MNPEQVKDIAFVVQTLNSGEWEIIAISSKYDDVRRVYDASTHLEKRLLNFGRVVFRTPS